MNKSALSGLIAFLLGVIYTYQSLQLPKATIGKAWAPIYFPLGLGILMTLFGLILLAQEIKRNGILKTNNEHKGISYTAKMIAYTSFISLIYAFLFDEIGYLLSTILFMGAMLNAINGLKKWRMNMIISISFALVIYITFSKFLGIILPPIPYIEF